MYISQLITRIRMLSMRVMFSTDGFTLAQGRLLLREATETAQDIFTEATMSGKDGASFLDNPKYKVKAVKTCSDLVLLNHETS